VVILRRGGTALEPMVLEPRGDRLPRLAAGDQVEVSCAVRWNELRGLPTRHRLRVVGRGDGEPHDVAVVHGIAVLYDAVTSRFERRPAQWLRSLADRPDLIPG
jgi:hypothetical protein